MNSRRLMVLPSAEAHNLAHHWAMWALCIAAKSSRPCRFRVMSGRWRQAPAMSALLPKPEMRGASRLFRDRAKSCREQMQQKPPLVDHVLGEDEDRIRDRQPDRLRGSAIYDHVNSRLVPRVDQRALRVLSTKYAARRYMVAKFSP